MNASHDAASAVGAASVVVPIVAVDPHAGHPHAVHDAQHEAFRKLHAGHEQLHLVLVTMMMVVMVATQVGLVLWKRRSPRSYDQITLLGLLLLPTAFSAYHGYVRFLVVWAAFVSVSAYFVSRPFFEKPLQLKTPRRIYWFFFLCNKLSFGVAFAGYAVLLVDTMGGRLGWAPFGVMLLFYGLLYGVIARDLATVCADKMAAQLGFGAAGGMPSRLVDERVCAICSDTLDSLTEDSIRLPGCGHVFHAFCIRGWKIVGKQECPCCHERVELGQVFTQPWEKQTVLWAYVLDVTRYMVVWNPIMLVGIQLLIRFFDHP